MVLEQDPCSHNIHILCFCYSSNFFWRTTGQKHKLVHLFYASLWFEFVFVITTRSSSKFGINSPTFILGRSSLFLLEKRRNAMKDYKRGYSDISLQSLIITLEGHWVRKKIWKRIGKSSIQWTPDVLCQHLARCFSNISYLN